MLEGLKAGDLIWQKTHVAVVERVSTDNTLYTSFTPLRFLSTFVPGSENNLTIGENYELIFNRDGRCPGVPWLDISSITLEEHIKRTPDGLISLNN